jgi:hypothetical protein
MLTVCWWRVGFGGVVFGAQEDIKSFPFKVSAAPDGGILINLMYEKVRRERRDGEGEMMKTQS